MAVAGAGSTVGLAFERFSPMAIHDDRVLLGIAHELADAATEREALTLERNGRYPERVLSRLAQRGLATCFADAHGVAEGDSRITAYHLFSLNALTASCSASLAVSVGVNALALLPAYLVATPAQLRWAFDRVLAGGRAALLLTEQHGSNLLRGEMQAVGRVVGSEGRLRSPRSGEQAACYQLRGDKHLINGGCEHALLTVLARTAPARHARGTESLGEAASYSVLMVARDETIRPLTRWRTLPIRGADIASVRFEDTVVPAAQRLGAEGHGFKLIRNALAISRGGIAAFASGTASRARELSAAYALRRAIYGRPIAELGAIREHLLRLAALDRIVACAAIKAAAATNALGLGGAHYTAVAKYACCELAEEAVAEGRALHGSAALLETSKYEPLNRDALVYGVFDGTSHVMLEELAWRLTQVAVGADTAQPLQRLRELYEPPPRHLVGVLRARVRVRLPAWPAEAAALGRVAGGTDLPLTAFTSTLVAVVEELRRTGRWDRDQALRFDAARWFAMLETLLSTIELADRHARVALGLAPVDESALEQDMQAFTVAWCASRIAAALGTLALRAGVDATELSRAQAQACDELEAARGRLPGGGDLAEWLRGRA